MDVDLEQKSILNDYLVVPNRYDPITDRYKKFKRIRGRETEA